MTALFLGVMKLLSLRRVKSRGIFTKVFCSIFLLLNKASFVEMSLRGELKCLSDFVNTALANQIYPDAFPWHHTSNMFSQGYISEIILVLPPKMQGLTAYIECQIMRDASLGVI